MITRPSTGPMKKQMRQPQKIGTRSGLSSTSAPSEPMSAPAQYVPFTAMSTGPRKCAGISSSIAAGVAGDLRGGRGVDGGVLAADAQAGDEPEHEERAEVPRQAAEAAADQVD